MTDTYCGECGELCTWRIQDNSFDHEFGTEHPPKEILSDCCDAEVFENQQLTMEFIPEPEEEY